jgi:hypothetical protein
MNRANYEPVLQLSGIDGEKLSGQSRKFRCNQLKIKQARCPKLSHELSPEFHPNFSV